MKADVVLAGVGGQGVVTVARLLAEAGRRQGLFVAEGELHGMSQRGGSVQASLRLSTRRIASPVVARGAADLVLGIEPLEALRCRDYLGPHGVLVASTGAVENVDAYPPLETVIGALLELPRAVVVPARRLAREAGSVRAANLVMVGAALAYLPLELAVVEGAVSAWATGRRERLRDANLVAVRLGLREALTAAA